jgi:hypothetical protein
MIQARVKYVFDTPGTDKRNGKLVKELINSEEYDAARNRFRVHHIVLVYVDGGSSPLIADKSTWIPVTGENVATLEFLRNEACAASPEEKMNLKDMLQRDFGLELKIAGGYGQSRRDPIVVLDSNPIDASMTEMQVLRGLGMGRRIYWRALARTPLDNGQLSLEQIKIEAKKVTASELITTRENYYFDVSKAAVHGKCLPEVIAFSDNRTKLGLPYELGWLHYDGVTDNEPTTPGMGQSIAYGAQGIKATVYLYDKKRRDIPADIDASVVRDELEIAVSNIIELTPTASQAGELAKDRNLLIQTFNIDGELSLIGIGVFQGKFIKLRMTFIHDPFLVEVVSQSIVAFQDVIA